MKTKPSLSSNVASLILIGAALIVLAILAFNSKDDVFGRVRIAAPQIHQNRANFSNESMYVHFEGSNGTDNVPFQYGEYSGSVCFGERGDSIHWNNVPHNFNYDFADNYIWNKYDELIQSL